MSSILRQLVYVRVGCVSEEGLPRKVANMLCREPPSELVLWLKSEDVCVWVTSAMVSVPSTVLLKTKERILDSIAAIANSM